MSELAWTVEIETPFGHGNRSQWEVVVVNIFGERLDCLVGKRFDSEQAAQDALEKWAKEKLKKDIKKLNVKATV